MSYEPTLVIKKSDLDKNSEKFEFVWDWKENERDVMKYINEVRTTRFPATIDGVDLIVCRPELTSFNKRVREKLKKLKIQFSETI